MLTMNFGEVLPVTNCTQESFQAWLLLLPLNTTGYLHQ